MSRAAFVHPSQNVYGYIRCCHNAAHPRQGPAFPHPSHFFYFLLLSFFSCFLSLLSILGMSRTCSQPERRTDVRGASLDSPTPAKVHSGYYTSSVATISSKMLPAGQPKSLPAFYDIADILTNENAAEKLMLQRGRNNFGLVVAPSAICCQDTKF